MIKNVVFDMGNVLLDYKPEKYTNAFLPQNCDRETVLQTLFWGPEWNDLDKGIITEKQALSSMLKKLPQNVHKNARDLFYGWQNYVEPNMLMNKVAIELHKNGIPIYVLSNTGVRLHVYWNRMPAFKYLDGAIYSADVQQMKPGKEIFFILFKKYQLNPYECIFVDDNTDNINTANQLGMKGFLYKSNTLEFIKFLNKNININLKINK